jgi:ribosomal-protein-alanine N-acetyltransferase
MTPVDAEELADLIATVPGSVDPARELTRPEATAWVAGAEDADVPLAYAVCGRCYDELELLALATRPEARRLGLARVLLTRAVSFAREVGARRVCLEVSASNAAARTLYESAGFVVFNVRRAYYRETGEDAFEMELPLSSA